MESWQRAQQLLRKQVGEEHYDAWIKPLRLARLEGGQAVIHVPSKFYRDWVRRHYLDLLRASLKQGDGPAPEIVFEIDGGKQHELFPEALALPTAKARPRRRRARPREPR